MKGFIIFLTCAAAFVLAITLLFFCVRWFSAATTSVSIVTPKPGIECALASTGDGTAISCWKSQP